MDRIKILVVDDESRMRKLLKDFLEREGYRVIDDAEYGRMAGMPRGAAVFEGPDHHADGAL